MPEDADFQRFLDIDINRAPGDREAFRIAEPGLLADDCASPEDDLVEGFGHGSVDAVDCFLAGEAGAGLEVGETAEGGADCEDSCAGCWDAQGAACSLSVYTVSTVGVITHTNVCPDADAAASEGDQGRFTTRGTPRGEIAVARVDGSTEDIVDGFRDHHGRGHVGLAVEDGACIEEQVDEGAVVCGGIVDQRGEPDGRVITDKIKIILDGNGKTVERAFCLASLLKVGV